MEQAGRTTTLPAEFEKKLRSLLADMEAATASHFMLSVREAGTQHDLVIGAFDTRTDILVSEMPLCYEALNGTYASLDAIKEKVLHEKYGAMREPGSTVWVCPKCHRSEGTVDGCKRTNSVNAAQWTDLCRFCSFHFNSSWHNIIFDIASGQVYSGGGGGSVSVLRPIGKIALL